MKTGVLLMIRENYQLIQTQINDACQRCGRKSDEVLLLAVSKTHPADKINECLDFGIKAFAENKIQEIETKMPLIHREGREFHFIGHLQSNKINKLLALKPDLIHSIDKLSTAEKLNQSLVQREMFQNVLIEVNTSGEVSKNGVEPDALIRLVKEISLLSNIHIKGLMTIGSLTEDEQEIRRCFRQLRGLFEEIKEMNIPHVEMKYLSMGMSGDFEIAIEEGSNMIRVGSLLFGQRDYQKA